ncbi:MAG: hypothetical protein KDB27_15420 [Planctomycetales bacterium]|nr:hypothetical protein [Planctomycetales bacterium]
MTFLQSMLFSGAIGYSGWYFAKHKPTVARTATAIIATSCLALLVALAISAAPKSPSWLRHRMLGHVLIIAVWLYVPLLTGIAITQNDCGWRRTAVRIGMLLLTLAITLFAAATGYMQPPISDIFAEESRNRFVGYHMFALPIALVVMFIYWLRMFRSKSRELRAAENPERAIKEHL